MVSRSTLRSVVLAALLVGSVVAAGTATAAPRPTGDRPTTADAAHDHATTAGTAPLLSANATVQRAGDIGTWTAPAADFDDLDDREGVRTAIRNGSLTRTDTVAERDVAVLAVPASGAFGALDRQKDEDEPYADAFVDLVESGEGFRFHLNQTNPAPNLAPARLDLAATNENDGLRVVPDERNGTLLVALKTDRLVLDRPDREDVRVRPGQEYEANFTIAESVGLSDGRRTALGTVEIAERTVRFDTGGRGEVVWSTADCNSLRGDTTVAPGSTLDLVVRGENRSFTWARTVTVAPDRTFLATFDTTDVGGLGSFTAQVRGFPDSDTPGAVARPVDRPQLRVSDQSSDGRTVSVGSVTMDTGGFVALYAVESPAALSVRRAPADGCPTSEFDADTATAALIGTSDALDAGQSTNVTVRLDEPLTASRTIVAVAHRDPNGDRRLDPREDAPYTANGTIVADGVTVSVDRPTTPTTTVSPTTDAPTTAVTPTTTATPHPPDTPEPTTTTPIPTTTADGPGFGPLVALLALVALTTLAARRRR